MKNLCAHFIALLSKKYSALVREKLRHFIRTSIQYTQIFIFLHTCSLADRLFDINLACFRSFTNFKTCYFIHNNRQYCVHKIPNKLLFMLYWHRTLSLDLAVTVVVIVFCVAMIIIIIVTSAAVDVRYVTIANRLLLLAHNEKYSQY